METPVITSRSDVMPLFGVSRNITSQATFHLFVAEQPGGTAPADVRPPSAPVTAAPTRPLVPPSLLGAVVSDRPAANVTHTREAYAAAVEVVSRSFAGELQDRLTRAGVDTSVPFTLKQDNEGRIRVAEEHPNRGQIERLFDQDRAFADDFRAVMHCNDKVAQQRFTELYTEAWRKDSSVEARTRVWEHFKGIHERLCQSLDQMRWNGTQITSPSQAFAKAELA